MRSRSAVAAAVLAALGSSAAAQAQAQVQESRTTVLKAPRTTAPRTIYSPARPSVAARPVSPEAPRAAPAPQPGVVAAASVPTVTRLTSDAREERRFLRDAGAQSRFELDASRLALARSGNGAVRALAASLVDHNATIGLELAHLLHSRGMAMPMITNEQRRALNRLTRLTGNRFDALYMQRVGLGQATLAHDYEKAGAAIRDPQINAWIARTLAATRYHQHMAERGQPADPPLAKLGRASGARPQATLPAAGRQNRSRPVASQPKDPAGAISVQAVAATTGGRLSGSDSR